MSLMAALTKIALARSPSSNVARPVMFFAAEKMSQNRRMGAHVETQAAKKIIRFIVWVATYKR